MGSVVTANVSVIVNTPAHGVSRARRLGGQKRPKRSKKACPTVKQRQKERKYPAALSDDELWEARHICIVMDPIRAGTRLVEGAGETALASMYKPVWHTAKVQLGPKKLLDVPEALRLGKGPEHEKIEKKTLHPNAEALCKFLHDELDKIQCMRTWRALQRTSC